MKIEIKVSPPLFTDRAISSGKHDWTVEVAVQDAIVVPGAPVLKTTQRCEGTEETWRDALNQAVFMATTISRAASDATEAANTQ